MLGTGKRASHDAEQVRVLGVKAKLLGLLTALAAFSLDSSCCAVANLAVTAVELERHCVLRQEGHLAHVCMCMYYYGHDEQEQRHNHTHEHMSSDIRAWSPTLTHTHTHSLTHSHAHSHFNWSPSSCSWSRSRCRCADMSMCL